MKKLLWTRLAAAALSISILALSATPLLAEKTEAERIAEINKENAEKGYLWTAGHTSVSGLSAAEKQNLYGIIFDPAEWKAAGPRFVAPQGMSYPSSFDWRVFGGVTPARNQLSCGSCWDFAGVGQLEAHIAIVDSRYEDLSEQQVLDCNSMGASCGGGWLPAAYEIFLDPGAVEEACYPYVASEGTCKQYLCEKVAKIAGFTPVAGDIESVKAAVMTGPVATLFRAEDNFSFYTTGCYSTNSTNTPNHAVVIVGWDDNACGLGQGAWIIKNSWGIGWGQEGFGYVKYGVCSIGMYNYQITYLPSVVYVNLTAPEDGEIWNVGDLHDITWTIARQAPDSISVLLSLNSGRDFDRTIARGLPGTARSLSWTVPNMPVDNARIKIVAYYGGKVGGYDMNGTDFTIKGLPRRYVMKTGSDIFPYSIPEWAARKIQDAENAASPGDSIFVAEGTYLYQVVVDEEAYILGGFDTTFSLETRDPIAHPTTLMTPGSNVSFMNVSSGVCGIEGFTLTAGTGTTTTLPATGSYGGGIFSYESSPIIKNNRFTASGYADATNYSAGGAIACYGGTPVIEGNTITSSVAQSGGGIYLYQTNATLRRNVITGSAPNVEYTGTKIGGGIYAYQATAALEKNRVSQNNGYRKGGGIYSYLSTLTMNEDTVSVNACALNGAGVYAERSSLSMSRARVAGNSTASSSGGGVYFRAGALYITNSIIAQNRSAILGGGVYADSAYGGIDNNTIDRNRAPYSGGNAYLKSMVGLSFKNNLVTYGSGYGLSGPSLANITCAYNGIFGNLPGNFDFFTPDSTNTIRHPHYADTLSGDYHLLVHSGGIDGGNPAGAADPDGSRADQGAYGGPGAAQAAPEYVKWITTVPGPDTLSGPYIVWDQPASAASYVIYRGATTGFRPDVSNLLATVPAPACSLLVPPAAGTSYFRVAAANAAGYGGGYSAQLAVTDWILPPEVAVVSPNGGEILQIGDTIQISWHATDALGIDSVCISYSTNAGAAYIPITSGCLADSTFEWIVPAVLSDSCLVMVAAYNGAGRMGVDASDSLFSIRNKTGVGDKGQGDEDGPPSYVTGLEQNYPNPFNGTTSIVYSVADRAAVEISIYDPAGRKIRVLERAAREAGRYSVTWNGRDDAERTVASGVYFCRIKAGKFSQTRKIIYLR